MNQHVEISRPVARVLVLDPSNHVLLLFDDRDEGRESFWYPPGGRIEEGEAPEQAARRELAEEVGLEAEIGPLVLCRRARFAYRGRFFDQEEWHFVARVDRPASLVSRQGDNETAAIAAHRWWSLPDLETTREAIFPERIAEVLRRVVSLSADGTTCSPATIRHRAAIRLSDTQARVSRIPPQAPTPSRRRAAHPRTSCRPR